MLVMKNLRVFLDIPTDSSIERICHRHTDPETGICYHQLYDPAPTTEISLRMVQRKEDEVYIFKKIAASFHRKPLSGDSQMKFNAHAGGWSL